MKDQLLSEEQIQQTLQTVPVYSGWEIEGGEEEGEPCTLIKQFLFKNFKDAFSWLTKLAVVSEEQNHHPTIVNTFNRVTISIFTHTAGGITQKDLDWIAAVEKIGKKIS